MIVAETEALLTLLRMLAPSAARSLIEHFGSAGAALGAPRSQWKPLGIDGRRIAEPDPERVREDIEWLAADPGRALIAINDPRYPLRLREIPDAPPALFCLGDPGLLDQPQIAIVGSRSATAAGIETARAFAEALSARGLVVTSGLAVGIDGAAHRGALAGGGGTIAVCGTGLDRVYPAQHRDLAHAIAGLGLLVSEFPPGSPPKADHFPRRNRLISGLALGVLVVEAARESGSLITARLAAEQGREVFAIPGSIHNPLARGCHQLIRQGAKLVETVDDILLELHSQLTQMLQRNPPLTVVKAQSDQGLESNLSETDTESAHDLRVLLQALDDAPTSVDAIADRLGWPADRLGAALLEAELTGQVASDAAGRIMKMRLPGR